MVREQHINRSGVGVAAIVLQRAAVSIEVDVAGFFSTEATISLSAQRDESGFDATGYEGGEGLEVVDLEPDAVTSDGVPGFGDQGRGGRPRVADAKPGRNAVAVGFTRAPRESFAEVALAPGRSVRGIARGARGLAVDAVVAAGGIFDTRDM